LSSKKHKKAIILNAEGISASNQELANQFNKYFISTAKNINNHNDSNSQNSDNTTTIKKTNSVALSPQANYTN
jgi:hypothetical protein